ncbi:MAG TPA: pyridoxal-dependent decarboxylase [Gemmatimonadaceae bacterium]|jgi:aromatic-L-amino-acid decarboxylase|nr:pyridoxal-dependent decarboxylase [Gemmatimonadaceae bacterium]
MSSTESVVGSVSDFGDLPVSELLTHGQAALEWIAHYLDHPERVSVLSRVVPGEIREMLPPSPPVHGEPLGDILRDFEQQIVPGITHWNHPGFFGYFATSSSVPGILGEMLVAALDVKAMLWRTSPAATELEQVTTDWLRQMLGLPGGWFGFLNDTASISSMLALAAAREAKPELDIRARGMAGRADLPRLRVYASIHAHSSIDKAVLALGLGLDNVVHIDVDDAFRMRPDALAAAIADDSSRGFLPLACVATVGTTSVTSIDPVPAIAEICHRESIWLHVDGAYGGIAAVVPEMRNVLAGVEHADSLVVNPHKWLFTPFDCSAFFTTKPDVLERAFSLVHEYLVTPERESVVDFMNYGVQLGRRFRALKLWMVIRGFGTSGLAARIRAHCALAREFADWVKAETEWEVVAPIPFSLVCFRYAPSGVHEEVLNEMNARILAHVNASGEVLLSHTKLDGRYVLRLAVGNIRTEERHVRRAWELLRESAPR